MTRHDYSLPEKARFILLYERNKRDYEEFCLSARRELNLRRHALPPLRTLQHWLEKFEETGSLERRPYYRDRYENTLFNEITLYPFMFRPARNEQNTELLDTLLEENPMLSTRRLSNELDISRWSVMRIIKDLAYHPYKLQLTHELSPEDLGTRLEFCLSQLEIIERLPNFAVNILFSDEAYFSLHGGVNTQLSLLC